MPASTTLGAQSDSRDGLCTCHRSTHSRDLCGLSFVAFGCCGCPPSCELLSLTCTMGTARLGFRVQSSWVWSARHCEQNWPLLPSDGIQGLVQPGEICVSSDRICCRSSQPPHMHFLCCTIITIRSHTSCMLATKVGWWLIRH